MTTIKAIETKYKGCRFRSRLEARYAVFFDALGMEWHYEPEGFELEHYGRYLPDFYLPQIDMWAEVKAKPFDINERNKAFALSSGTNKPVIQLTSMPEPHYFAFVDLKIAIGSRMKGYENFYFANDFVNWYLSVNNLAKTESSLQDALAWDVRYYQNKYGKPHPSHFKNGLMVHDCWGIFNTVGNEMIRAITAARSARFEFLEFPCS